MIPLFFTLFVKAFIMNPYMESHLWKCLWFSKTIICESYFHWKGRMISKWGNVTPSLHERKEASAFTDFVKRQQDKKILSKKLVKSKYAATLTVASAQKNSHYEWFVLEEISGMCGGDDSVDAAVEHYTAKCNIRQMNRQKLLDAANEEYENNVTCKTLKIGPGKLELRSTDSNGCITGSAFCESTMSARPVPPFPFKNDDLLGTTQLQRLEDVWAISRGIKERRNLQDSDAIDDQIDIFCCICNDVITAERSICTTCRINFHPFCLEINSAITEI